MSETQPVTLLETPALVYITWIDSFSPSGEWHNLEDVAETLKTHNVSIESTGYLFGWNDVYWLFAGHKAKLGDGWILGQTMFIPRATSYCRNIDGTNFEVEI